MKSDDGLAGGPFTEDNLVQLSKILVARGVPTNQLNEILSSIIQNHWQETDEAIARTRKEPEVADPNDIYSQLRITKELNKVFVDGIKKIVDLHPEYLTKFDSVEVPTAAQFPSAVKAYNAPENHVVNREINKITGPSLGKGELVFVWLIRGCKSGGSGLGDIILSNGDKVDVKAHTDKVFRIEQNSIDNFQGLPFFVALMDLVSEIRSDPMVGVILSTILNAPVEGEEPLYPTTIAKTEYFIEHLNLDSVNNSMFNGLFFLKKRLMNMEVDNEADVLSINTNGNKLSAALTNPDEVIPGVAQLKEPETFEVDVAPIDDPEGKVVLPRIKRLKFFSDDFSMQRITDEIVGALHYDGIVFVNNIGENAMYVDKADFSKKLEFYNFSKGVNFKLKL